MQNEDYIYNGERVIRVNKKVARQMYNNGKQIWLIPDMMRLDNTWQSPCPVDNKGEREFDAIVSEFRYYNCDSERGRGVKYFIADAEK